MKPDPRDYWSMSQDQRDDLSDYLDTFEDDGDEREFDDA